MRGDESDVAGGHFVGDFHPEHDQSTGDGVGRPLSEVVFFLYTKTIDRLQELCASLAVAA